MSDRLPSRRGHLAGQIKKRRVDVWDSGKVYANQSVDVPYGGTSLHSGERVYWNVHVGIGMENSSPPGSLRGGRWG